MIHTPICLECQSRTCEHIAPPPVKILSRRESEILWGLKDGLCTKDLAALTGLTPATVKVYKNRLFPKIGVTTSLGAALWAKDHRDILRPLETRA